MFTGIIQKRRYANAKPVKVVERKALYQITSQHREHKQFVSARFLRQKSHQKSRQTYWLARPG